MTSILTLCMVSGLISAADGNAFRGSGLTVTMGQRRAADLRAAMLEELAVALGSGNRVTEQRLGRIEDAMNHIFRAMPKNAHGNLDHSGVRYVLHRLFVDRHRMFVKGLEPGRKAWNSSSPTEVLEDRVPEYVQNLFEERLDGRGLGMHEVAILAATLEHLIHDEAVERLKLSYDALKLSMETRLSPGRAKRVLKVYMLLFLKGVNASEMEDFDVGEQTARIRSEYPGWRDTINFAHGVLENVSENSAADPGFAGGELAFSAISRIVEEIGERYGRWQERDCHDLKANIMKLENTGLGRVLLRDFYADAMEGGWQFSESVSYLRDHGILDESDPKQKSVMIPNYITSPSNCLASSGIYSVCCPDECEPLLGHLEREIAEPDATPAHIAGIVANLPSDTIEAPRVLSEALRSRLEEVASHHGGRVPLHGRLFAQWLHHAYPRECPYPHMSGTTSAMSLTEWVDQNGAERASREEMWQHAYSEVAPEGNVSGNESGSVRNQPLQWSAEEELVMSTPAPSSLGIFLAPLVSLSFHCEAFLYAAFCSSFLLLVSHVLGPRRSACGKNMCEVLPFSDKAKYC